MHLTVMRSSGTAQYNALYSKVDIVADLIWLITVAYRLWGHNALYSKVDIVADLTCRIACGDTMHYTARLILSRT
jgi:hypothetical protein